jgi:hexokinase
VTCLLRHDYHNLSPYVPSTDYLADSVDAFLTSSTESQDYSHNPNPIDADMSAIPLGLTFSFPVEQTALDKGILLTWTKGFAAKNAVNKDVVKLLQDAFDRKHLHVKCVALVNDVSLLSFQLAWRY